MNDIKRLCDCVERAIPSQPPPIIPWAEANVILPGSARSQHFNSSITPWIIEPLERSVDTVTRLNTLVKPVQSGGSVFGEVLMLYWMMFWRGFLQYNWSNDKRSTERWSSRIEGIIEACEPIKARIDSLPKDKAKNEEIDFGKLFFRMQGVFVADNLDSDSIQLQINEEIHRWEPGHLQKARGRQTAVWNHKGIDISNASMKGDQLNQAFEDGTMQFWEVKCPGCSNPHHAANAVYHQMRTRWEDKRPDLGGLRYDADGCRRPDGSYDYNRLRPTIRFQMPCGYKVNYDPTERRALSLGGRYCEPTNTGAELSHRSYTYEAVAVDYIDWMMLIKEKHQALFARRYGDPEPWIKYITERECLFYDPEKVPIVGGAVLSANLTKDRNGIPNRLARFGALDRQQGELAKGELPHWWAVIRDVAILPDGTIHTLLVFEGKLETDEQAAEVMTRHTVEPQCVVVDTGDDTMHVYKFCMQHGFNGIKGGGEIFYPHPDSSKKIFSFEKPLHGMFNAPSKYEYVFHREGWVPDAKEPLYWFYSKASIRNRLAWLRTAKTVKFETPGDVSEDYQSHMESEEKITRKHPRTGEKIEEWHQLKERNDLFVCECYIAMQMEMAGIIGTNVELPQESNVKT